MPSCTFMPWLLDFLDQPMYASESQNSIPSQIPRYTPRLVSRIDYGFDQCSVVSFVIKKVFCIYLWWKSVYMLNYTNVLYANIFLTLGIKFGNKFTYIFVFPNFLLTLNTTLAIKERKILRRLKTQFEGKQCKSDYEQQSFVL